MKFLCDRCKTRYAIADERVRGKILKIRCKNCSAVITVREGMDEAAEPTTASTVPPALEPSAPEAPPPAALDEEWYVSRDGNQEGPFTLTEAQAWIAARAGDDDLFCWNEGFDDWLPVEKVSHFRGLRGTPRNRPATRPGAVKEPEPQPLFAATLAAIEAEAAAASAATAAKLATTTGGAVQVPAAKNPAPSQWRTPGPPTGDETLDMPVPDAAQLMAGARPAPVRSATPAVGVPALPRAATAAPPLPRTATPAVGVPAIPRAGAPATPITGTPIAGVRPAAIAPAATAPATMAPAVAAPAAIAPAATAPAGGMRLEPAAATPPPRTGGLPQPFGVSRTAPGVAPPQLAPHAAAHAAPHAAAAAPTPSPAAPAAYTPPPSVAPAAYTPPPSVAPAAYTPPSVAPAAYTPPPSVAPTAMPAAPIAALAPAPATASAPAWSPPPPVAHARPPAARFDNGASDDEAAAEALAAAQPAPAPSFGDDDLDIGEVSRVVKLADLGRAPAAGRAAAKPRAATAGIGRGTGAVSSFGANPSGMTAPAERSAGGFGGDIAPAIDPGASLAAPTARRRSPVLYIGIGLVAVAIAVVAVIVLSGGGEDTSGNETAGGNDYDNLGYRPNDPVGKRPGSNDPGVGTGSGPGTAAIKPPDRGSGSGTGRRPGSSIAATPVDAGVAASDPGVNAALPDLSPDDVFSMSARMESGTRRCYERAMKADPFLKVSKIRATIKVSAAGPVSDVTLSTMANTQLGTCLVAAIKRWPFKPSQTGIVSEFALVFEQK